MSSDDALKSRGCKRNARGSGMEESRVGGEEERKGKKRKAK